MMEEEERKCKEEKRKVDSSKTILRKEKGLVSSVMIKEMLIHVLKKKICNVFRCKRCEAAVPTPTCLRW